MHLLRRMVYVGFGALLALAMVAGGVMVFAQSDEDAHTPLAQDGGDDAETEDEAQDEDGLRPGRRVPRLRGRPGAWSGDRGELLADALGISVEELQEARDEVRAAQLEAMVEAGILTQEQADLMAAREAVQEYVDREELAATIREAYEEAIEAALDAGDITQEQAEQLLETPPTFGPFGFGRGGHHHGPVLRGGPDGDVFVPGTSAPVIDSGFDA